MEVVKESGNTKRQVEKNESVLEYYMCLVCCPLNAVCPYIKQYIKVTVGQGHA